MLASLKINNVALIESLEINFANNLNVISGETGSGKSILLNALGFVVGDRLDKTMLRTGTDVMKVDAIFIDICDSVCKKITEKTNVNIENGEILISREYSSNGKTVCKVNGELVTTTILKQISSYLIDIHGQHQHQALLNPEFQLSILDKFCGDNVTQKLTKLNEFIDGINEINQKLNLLGGDKIQKQNLIDLYSYQINEIEKADIKENELESLTERFKEMKDSEKISSSLNESLSLLDKNSYNQTASEQISNANRSLASLTIFSDKYNNVYNRLNSLSIELEDIIEEINTLNNGLVFDQNEFDTIDQRIDYIKTIFRKYGGDYNGLQTYKNEISEKLANLINSEEVFNELTDKKEKLIKQIVELETEISYIRKQNAVKLQTQIQKELQNLGMPKAVFEIDFGKTSEVYTRTGSDVVEFMFSANLGFEPKPLNKVASGGEISRFMLAYKIVVNNIDEINTLIFDEIDTGISGNIANVVANCMGRLSRQKQLIVVSHLPHICAMADMNLLVAKVTNSTTITTLKELKGENVYPEIARLMGLINLDGIEYAKKLKNTANEYKKNLYI